MEKCAVVGLLLITLALLILGRRKTQKWLEEWRDNKIANRVWGKQSVK